MNRKFILFSVCCGLAAVFPIALSYATDLAVTKVVAKATKTKFGSSIRTHVEVSGSIPEKSRVVVDYNCVTSKGQVQRHSTLYKGESLFIASGEVSKCDMAFGAQTGNKVKSMGSYCLTPPSTVTSGSCK